MSFHFCDREDDERVLRMIRLRCRGVSAPRIGQHMGTSAEYVRTATDKVRKADVAYACKTGSEAPEAEADVQAAYWRGHGR